jgi:predicted transport protein
MGPELVKSEFTIKNKRIDTLAYDAQACAFIIIEYKREKNISVVDQGFTYLSLMLENKADFIVEYNESLKRSLKREDVDWSQTRVAFVSTNFTDNQVQATNFKDIAIELWEVKQFENDTIIINPIKKSNAAESIKPLTQNKEALKKVTEEIKVYTEDEHLSKCSETIVELYNKFRQGILQLADEIEIKPKKMEIGFRKDSKVFSDICILKNSLKIWINLKKGLLDDPKHLAEDVSEKGHWGNGDYQIQVDTDKDLEYIMSLIKQSIKK